MWEGNGMVVVVYMGVHVGVCTGQCNHVCARGGQRSLSGVFLYCSSPYFWRLEFSLSLKLTDSAPWRTRSPSDGICCSPPQCGVTTCKLCLAFYVGAGGSSEFEPFCLHSNHSTTETAPGPACAMLSPIVDPRYGSVPG